MKATTKSFVVGVAVGMIAYHVYGSTMTQRTA
jgi:hypothetical protein